MRARGAKCHWAGSLGGQISINIWEILLPGAVHALPCAEGLQRAAVYEGMLWACSACMFAVGLG